MKDLMFEELRDWLELQLSGITAQDERRWIARCFIDRLCGLYTAGKIDLNQYSAMTGYALERAKEAE